MNQPSQEQLLDAQPLDQFLTRHCQLSETRLAELKQEALQKKVPVMMLLESLGMVDDIQAKWEEVFRSTPWAKYPSEEMIRFVARTYQKKPDRSAVHFLDLGCGIGTSCWYLAKEGYTATGIDCSPSAIEFAQAWFTQERLKADFQVGLMQELPYPDNTFDCVIDNGSSTSTPLPMIRTILAEARRVLKPGGRYYGMFLGDETTIEGAQGAESGDAKDSDPKFYREITGGPIQRAATVRLLNEPEIKSLFVDASQLSVDYALRTVNNRQAQVQYWHISAVF